MSTERNVSDYMQSCEEWEQHGIAESARLKAENIQRFLDSVEEPIKKSLNGIHDVNIGSKKHWEAISINPEKVAALKKTIRGQLLYVELVEN